MNRTPDTVFADIHNILMKYLQIPSFSNTAEERRVDDFFADFFSAQSYFQTHSNHFGKYPVQKDALQRHVHWGLRQGEGSKTVVLIHHYDVVDIDNFQDKKEFAFNPPLLQEKLKMDFDRLDVDATADLKSGEWLFGRGTADMKSGGAIQLALLQKYASVRSFTGNVIVLALPDEENLSSGMRSAVSLLKTLKDKYTLDYVLMINSEPHQRFSKNLGVLSQGSIGKANMFVYVKGALTHVGKIFEGLNPNSLLAKIVWETEVDLDFLDICGDEASVPPTWIYMKDRKRNYDVSTPFASVGYLNVLNFFSTPDDLLTKLKKKCENAIAGIQKKMNVAHAEFERKNGRTPAPLSWTLRVLTFSELYKIVLSEHGQSFEAMFAQASNKLSKKFQDREIDLLEMNNLLVEFLLDIHSDPNPYIVIGFAPPFYPGVTNYQSASLAAQCCDLHKLIDDFTSKKWHQHYHNRHYYTGISDLSYSTLNYDKESTESLISNMPLWGDLYSIPFGDIGEISMPCVNIGPWGKDFHKMTERVLKEDVFARTPAIIEHVIDSTLKG